MQPTRIKLIGHFILLPLLALSVATAEARHGQRPASMVPVGAFDYYVLSLSWSPTWCLAHPGDVPQCDPRMGYGFVLHGLWPQYAGRGWPQNCPTDERLAPRAVAFGKTIFPSPKLIRHEWQKHGTCSGLSALDYFQAADRARTNIRIPPEMDAPAGTRSMPAGAIARSILNANPGMPADALAVYCRGPELAEVRVCLDKQLAPMACGKGVRSNCRRGPIRIPAVR